MPKRDSATIVGDRALHLEMEQGFGALRTVRRPDQVDEIVIILRRRDLTGDPADSSSDPWGPFGPLTLCMWLMSPCFPEHCPPGFDDVVECLNWSEDDFARVASLIQGSE